MAPDDWTAYVSEDDQDPREVAALNWLPQMTDADHIKILEDIPSGNPHIKNMLDGARAKKLGQ